MPSLPHHLWLRQLESIIDISPLTVEPETLLSDAILQMASRGVGIVVVANSQVLGYLSATDVVKLVALGVDLQNTQISEVLNAVQGVFQLSQFEDLATIISLLSEYQSSCLLVVDEQEHLMGIITCESIYQALEAVTKLNKQEQLQTPQAHLKLLASTVNANNAISASQDLWRIADTRPVLIWMSGTDTLCKFFNQNWLEFTGSTLEQEICKSWAELVHSEDLQNFLNIYLSAFHARKPFSVEYRLRRVDGQYIWFLNTGVPQFTGDGNFDGYISSCIDIDEYKQTFTPLEARQTIYWERNLSNDQLLLLNPVDVGVTRQLTHNEALNCIHADDRKKVEMAVQDAIACCGFLEVEHRLSSPKQESEYKWFLSRARVITDTTGKPNRMIGVSMDISEPVPGQTALAQANQKLQRRVAELTLALEAANKQLLVNKGDRGIDRDITVRKQVEHNLYQTQKQLQTILDKSSAVIYVTDLQNRYILINQRYEKLYKLTQAEIIGKSIYDIWPDDVARGFALNNQQVLNNGIALEVEEVIPHEDGIHTYFSIKFPLKDQNGVTYGICGISTDITERKLAENALLRFHKAMESTSDAIIFSDILDKSIYINPAFAELYGYSLEELQAHGGVRTVFQQPLERQPILDTVMKGNSWRGEVTMRSRDGRVLKVDMRSDALKDSRGRITGIVCIHTDVTQHQQIEEGLRLRDRAIDASSNGIIIADATTPNGAIIYVNPAFERMTGYLSQEVMGKNFRIFQSADIDQPGLRELSAAMQAGKACTVVLRNYRKNGSLLWNELNISPVYDTAGQLTHYIGIQTDITERKQAETALLVSQQRLQYLLTSSPAVIYTSQNFGDFGKIFISDNVTAMTGYEAREFTDDPSFWANHIHPDDLAQVLKKLSNVLERKNYRLEYRFLHKDRAYRWLYDQGCIVEDDINNPVEMVGYLVDITERKQLEEYLKVALEKEKELSELKSRFVSMTSHEFRTPLSTILSSSELLEHYRHKWTEEKQLTHLNRIQTAVQRMTEMLNDILIIGKAEAGKLEFAPKSFDVVAYCRTLVEEIQLNLTNHQVEFISEHESISCYMDDKILGHILSNLISNAIKYSSVSSPVQVKFYCRDEQAVFEVQDWGMGIPPEEITHLFESFYRARNVGNILGTGLGLAIVKKCVDICQGQIFVSSTLGVGTVFTVNLPLNYQI